MRTRKLTREETIRLEKLEAQVDSAIAAIKQARRNIKSDLRLYRRLLSPVSVD